MGVLGGLCYLGDEGDAYASVGADQLHQHLRANVLEEVLNVLPDEVVLHDGLPARGRTKNSSPQLKRCTTKFPLIWTP